MTQQLAQKQDRKYLKDAKAFPGEKVISLHRLMVCDLEVNRRKSSQKGKFQPRRKVWKIRNPEVRKRFEEVLDIKEKEERNINQLWESTRNGILKATEEVCGWTKGPARHLQTW